MTFDDGILYIYAKTNLSEKGDKPDYKLLLKSAHYFGFETIGFNRRYTAKKADEEIDALVRIDFDENINNDDICILENNKQYLCKFIQHFVDNGLRYTRITLQEAEKNYDIDNAET